VIVGQERIMKRKVSKGLEQKELLIVLSYKIMEGKGTRVK
jgi:hypothetical protein